MHPVFLLPLATGFLFAIGSLFDKYVLENKMENPLSYFFLQSFIAMALFPALSILLFGLEIPSPSTLLLIFFAAIAANTGFFLYIKLVERYDISSVGPLTQTKLLFAIPLAFLFLNEFYGIAELFLMLLILAGAILTTYSKNLSFKSLVLDNRLLFLALCMSFAWALSDLPVKMISEEISGASFLTWRYLFTIPIIAVFAIFLFKGKARKALSRDFRRTIPFSLLASLMGFSGMMLLFSVYSFSYTIPSALVLSQAIFVFAIAFIISRIKSSLIAEKEPLKVYAIRLLGVLLIISSIYFLITGNMAL